MTLHSSRQMPWDQHKRKIKHPYNRTECCTFAEYMPWQPVTMHLNAISKCTYSQFGRVGSYRCERMMNKIHRCWFLACIGGNLWRRHRLLRYTFLFSLFKAMVAVVMRCEYVYSVSHFFQGTTNAYYQLLSSTCTEEVTSQDWVGSNWYWKIWPIWSKAFKFETLMMILMTYSKIQMN